MRSWLWGLIEKPSNSSKEKRAVFRLVEVSVFKENESSFLSKRSLLGENKFLLFCLRNGYYFDRMWIDGVLNIDWWRIECRLVGDKQMILFQSELVMTQSGFEGRRLFWWRKFGAKIYRYSLRHCSLFKLCCSSYVVVFMVRIRIDGVVLECGRLER